MCMQVRCPSCSKIDWRGCGAHVAEVMANVPPEERCRCREAPPKR